MSVIVKGMKMPQGSCEWVDAEGHLHRCKLLNGDDDCKMQEGICADATWEDQFSGCPLIELPTPHGRLIDVDDFMRHLIINTADLRTLSTGTVGKALHDTPTVIEAEAVEAWNRRTE